MMKVFYLVGYFVIISLFSGCAVQKTVVGEFYLQQKSYDKGYAFFKEKLQKEPNNASNHYYLGRILLSKKQNKEALSHLKKATTLDRSTSKYFSWLGVAYAANQDAKNERGAYKKALSLDKNNHQALLYLAHNNYERKRYEEAIGYYERVLKLLPKNQSALYYRAMALHNLGRKAEEKAAFQQYIKTYSKGAKTRKATTYLNRLGDFEYRNFLIGLRKIALHEIRFKPFTLDISLDSQLSLDAMGEILEKNPKVNVHIISYQIKNKNLAKQKAKKIKTYLLERFPTIASNRLLLSWFDTSKQVHIHKQRYTLYENIDIITANR